MSFIEWKDLFDDVFEGYQPDNWTLTYVHRNDTSQSKKLENANKMVRHGYARFHCPKCSNNWASAKAQVALYIFKSNYSSGCVKLRFFGQQCRRCSRSKEYFVDPEFESDWIQLTLDKLYEKVGCIYYGKPKLVHNNSKEKSNNIQGPHEKSLCEACKLGCCDAF